MLPHRVCLNFDSWLMSSMVIGNGMTSLAYLLIPLLLHLILKDTNRLAGSTARPWAEYARCFFASRYWLGTLSQSFILACGAGHVMTILVLYTPSYQIQAVVDLWTGITSLLTVILLFIVRKSAIRCTLKQEN